MSYPTTIMAEEEVNYASVVFKAQSNPKKQAKTEEETVYDEVKDQGKKPEATAATKANKKEETVYNEVDDQGKTPELTANTKDFLLEERPNRRSNHHLVRFLGILCVILLLGFIGVSVYFATSSDDAEHTSINELRTENKNLRRNQTSLEAQYDNLTQSHAALETENRQLTMENKNLTAKNQELQTEKNNLTEQIKNIHDGCCKPCPQGWLTFQSSCYAVNNVDEDKQQTWRKAQQDCISKVSHLTIIGNVEEKKYIQTNSWGDLGYWTGLRVVDRVWTWVDGSTPKQEVWSPPTPQEDLCVISKRLTNGVFEAVNCSEKHRWICERKASSVKT